MSCLVKFLGKTVMCFIMAAGIILVWWAFKFMLAGEQLTPVVITMTLKQEKFLYGSIIICGIYCALLAPILWFLDKIE